MPDKKKIDDAHLKDVTGGGDGSLTEEVEELGLGGGSSNLRASQGVREFSDGERAQQLRDKIGKD